MINTNFTHFFPAASILLFYFHVSVSLVKKNSSKTDSQFCITFKCWILCCFNISYLHLPTLHGLRVIGLRKGNKPLWGGQVGCHGDRQTLRLKEKRGSYGVVGCWMAGWVVGWVGEWVGGWVGG